jgi:regulator of protease activity HflC (stomatin/prohibitin superfamily)
MKSGVGLVIAVVLFIFGGVTFFSGFYTVDEGFVGVKTRNGAVIGEASPGFGWKVPFIDDVTEMSVQTVKTVWEGEQAVTAYSKDIQQANLKVSINTRLARENVSSMYSTVGIDYATNVIAPQVVKRIKEEMGQYTAAEVVVSREKLGLEIERKLAPDLARRGIILETLQIENVDFSEVYENAAEQAAKAEADVKTAKQQLEQARVKSQTQIAEAQAKAEATKVTANAEAYAIEQKGKAEALVISLRAEALASNAAIVDLTAVEKWNGSLPATMLPGSTLPFLGVK